MSRPLKIQLSSGRNLRTEMVIGCCFADADETSFPTGLNPEITALLRSLAGKPGAGDRDSLGEATTDGGRRLLVIGVGTRRECDQQRVAWWARRSLEEATRRGASSLGLLLPSDGPAGGPEGVERVALALRQARYRFEDYVSDAASDSLRSVSLVPVSRATGKAHKEALATAEAVAAGVSLARDLGNTPPNVASPAWVAKQAQSLARRHGARVLVLGPRELARKKMGGILAVGQGSANSPRLVRLSWGQKGPKVALVGKGVTFDSGGISIKPAASMEEMKYDKCGACAVLGVVEAAARLRLPIRLDAVLPLAENMPDAASYRPSDIVRCYNGKTVEIHNTDAEERMILADALSWAAESKPDHMVEFSTLTGATVVALGPTGAALYSPDDDLANSLLRAAEHASERLWRMPLWPEFLESMKGNHADLANAGERWGGGNTAAAFLSQFVGEMESWAHLDIAGPAYTTKAAPGDQTGATGYGVALATRWLRDLDKTGSLDD